MNGSVKTAALWVIAIAVMVAALLAPALWNGFPIVFYDTGGYLARPFEQRLELGRSAAYGVFLALGRGMDFWPNIVAQALLVVWMVRLTLRAHGFAPGPLLTATVVAGLCALTGISWYAAQLMPDILVPAAVLALYLLAFRARELRRWEVAALVALLAFSIASHMSILALTLGLALTLVVIRFLADWARIPRPGLVLPAAAVLAGILFAPLSNLAVLGEFKFTPGGANFIFSRLVQDGIVQRYLADHCPDPAIKLCDHLAEIPHTADEWLWDDGVLRKVGDWPVFEPEARRIIIETVWLYPGLHLTTALHAWLDQLLEFRTGDGLTPWTWHTQWIIERYAPDALADYLAARQHLAEFDFTVLNAVHVPMGFAAMAALCAIPFARRRVDPAARALALFVLIAMLGNAAICGILSNPHARYQSRLLPLAALAAAITALGWRRGTNRLMDLSHARTIE